MGCEAAEVNVCTSHAFAEVDGALHACAVCGFKPLDAIAALNKALDRARGALSKASDLTWDVTQFHVIVSGALYDVGKIVRSMEVIIP